MSDEKQKQAEKKPDDRARAWTFVCYPESAPDNWREILDQELVPWVESPLHDKDPEPDGSGTKKAHWHIILLFSGKKSFSQVKQITDDLGQPIPQRVNDIRSMVRYLIHKDHPHKYQYDQKDIVCHCGAEIEQYFSLSSVSKDKILWDIIAFIDKNEVTNLMSLLNYVQANGLREWFDVICNRNSIIIKAAIDACYQRQAEQANKASQRAVMAESAKQLAQAGYSLRGIGEKLGISKDTVSRLLKSINN